MHQCPPPGFNVDNGPGVKPQQRAEQERKLVADCREQIVPYQDIIIEFGHKDNRTDLQCINQQYQRQHHIAFVPVLPGIKKQH